MLNHGGKLQTMALEYGIPTSQWLDLSTGISPYSYPIPTIPESVWRSLPQWDEELIELAKHYYGAPSLLPLSGSQSGIQLLPRYRLSLGFELGRVWLPEQGYKEHEKAWREAGFSICHYRNSKELEQLAGSDILVVINPNNPSSELIEQSFLVELHNKLAANQGWLVVDEAFMDSEGNGHSMAGYCDSEHLFVFRSMGKFFGLAGIRLGFVAAAKPHLSNLQAMLGPWHLNGPACHVAKVALADQDWQHRQRVKLNRDALNLAQLLQQTFGTTSCGTNLFQTLYLANAETLYQALCQQGVYVRLTDELDALRFGIPNPVQLERLAAALQQIQCKD